MPTIYGTSHIIHGGRDVPATSAAFIVKKCLRLLPGKTNEGMTYYYYISGTTVLLLYYTKINSYSEAGLILHHV